MANAFGALRSAWGLSEWPTTSGPTYANHTLDASNDGIGFVFLPDSLNPITHVGVRYGVATGTPPTYKATVEVLDDNAYPNSDTDIGGGSPTSVTFTPPADTTWDGLFKWFALTNPYTPPGPGPLCFTIRYSSGTINASNMSTFTTSSSGSPVTGGHEYGLRMTAGNWVKQTSNAVYGVRTASTRQGWPSQAGFNTRSDSTVGHRYAMKMTLESGFGSTFRVKGFRFLGSAAGTAFGKNPVAGIWDSSGVLQSVVLSSGKMMSAASSFRSHTVMFDPSTLATLNNGTDYYIGLEVADAVNGGVLINGIKVSEADDLLAIPGGTSFIFSSFNGTSWTDDPTVRPYLEMILDDITVPTAGAGGGSLLMGGLGQTGIGVF